jgi:hypothetical protein
MDLINMKKGKAGQIPVYEICYDSTKEMTPIKTLGKKVLKIFPTERGVEETLSEIKKILKKKRVSYDKSYFRIFNHSRIDNLLSFGSDRADCINKRKFDLIEWELYSFRLVWDYFYTNKKGQLLACKNGPLLKNSMIKNGKEFFDRGGIRNVYNLETDKEVVNYYKKIVKKYKYLDKDKTSKYYGLYQRFKKIETMDYNKGKEIMPEFLLTEKMAMKKYGLMKDDVTWAYTPRQGQGMEYILKNAIKNRVHSKIAALAVYRDLKPILPRVTGGGYDETGFYTFKKERIKHLVALFLLIPQERK